MKHTEYENPGAAERIAALFAEAEANAARIQRASIGMPSIGVRVKPSNIVAYGEALNDPDAREHTPDGFPVFSSLRELRGYAAKKAHKEGRKMRVDPDGGVQSTADKRKEAQAWRDRRNKRRERVKKQGDLTKRLAKALGRTE